MPDHYQTQAEKALAYTAQQIAKMHQVDPDVISRGQMFTVEPEVQQRLEQKRMMIDPFLSKITNLLVPEISGKKVSMLINEPVSRRTAQRGPRKPEDKLKLLQSDYQMEQVERDVEMGWHKLAKWTGKFPEFFRRFMSLCNQRRAQDILITGWHGQFAEVTTDPVTYPKLQDLNIGWIQHAINVAPEKILGIKPDGTVDEIRVGEGGDYENMHELVHYLAEKYIDPIHIDRTDISCITGRELIADNNGKLYANWAGTSTPSEQRLIESIIALQNYGRRPIEMPAFAPQRLVMLSPLDNISRYVQAGTVRVKPAYDDHDTKAIKDLEYLWESFQIEDLDCFAMVHPDAISLKNKAGEWVPLSAEKKWAVTDPTPDSVDPALSEPIV
jgi:P2 family phage major capsid protein